MKYCPYCGSHLDTAARFCVACGAKQPTDLPPSLEMPCLPAKQPKKWDRRDVLHAIRAVLVMLVALAMLATAFLPTFAIVPEQSSSELMGLEGVEFKISTVQAIVLWRDTAKQLDENELYDSELMRDVVDSEEDFYDKLYEELDEEDLERLDDYGDIPKDARRSFDRMMYLSLRLTMQSEDTVTPYSLTALGIFSVLYLLLAFVTFLFGVLYLLSACGAFESGRFRRAAISLGFALPMTLIALRSATSFTFGPNKIQFLSAATVALALGALLWVACLVCSIIERQMPRVRTLLWRIPAIALATVLLFTLEGTVFSFKIKTEFDGDDEKRMVELDEKASFFNGLILPDSRYTEIEEWAEDMDSYDMKTEMELRFGKFSFYTRQEVEDGEADELNGEIVHRIGALDGFHDTMEMYAILPVLYLLAAISACAILWQMLLLTAGERYRRDAVISAKLVGAVAMIGALVLLLLYLSTMRGYISDYMPKGYRLSIGTGVITSAVLAGLAVFCPSRIKPRRRRKKSASEATEPTPVVEEAPVETEFSN